MKIIGGGGGGDGGGESGGGGLFGLGGEPSGLEHLLLDAARYERPGHELVAGMERALGIGAAAAPIAPPSSAATAAGTGTGAMTKGALFAWLSGGAVALVVGAVVVTRALTGAGMPPAPGAPVNVTAPAAAVAAPGVALAPLAAEPRATLAMSARRARVRAAAARAGGDGGVLRDEMQRLERARAAVRAGDGAQALRDLDGYSARHPRGTFTPEATALRAEALDLAGDHRAASALARRFIAANPAHPLVERLEPLAR